MSTEKSAQCESRDFTKDYSPRHSLSVAVRHYCKEVGGQSGYIWTFFFFFGWEKHALSNRRLLLITNSRHLKVTIFCAFLCTRRCKRIWGHRNSSWCMHLTASGPVHPKHSVLWFPPSWVSLKAPFHGVSESSRWWPDPCRTEMMGNLFFIVPGAREKWH